MIRGRRFLVVMAGVSAALGAGGLTVPYAAAAGAVPAVSGAVRSGGSWGKAIPVPGLAALGRGGYVLSLSCGSAGNCAVVGLYQVHGHSQGFVATEWHGRWGKARKLPAVGALYEGRGAGVFDVSCGSAATCEAGGYYRDHHGHDQAFVVAERNGRWGRVTELPGLGGVGSLSCTSAGSCTAAGDGSVVAERDGRWGKAVALPGLAALGGGVSQVSCASPGNCAVGGDYADNGDSSQGWVAAEKNGVWGKAIEVPGLAALNKSEFAEVNSVSCGAAGSCAAVGDYADSIDNSQGWVATEKNGVWGKAFEPPGLAALNGSSGGGNAETNSVSCRSAGNCTAVGTYGDPYGTGFVATEKNGVWGQTEIVGVVGGRIAEGDVVSCASASNCAAGGFDSNGTGSVNQAWVSTERNGGWDDGSGVPGLRALNKGGYAETDLMSCPSAGRCVASGFYSDRNDHSHEFVVSQTG